jgi:ferric-dicitrate binding protein FerR (iron transport regulator)
VNFNDKKIKVLGTAFNVRNYSDEKNDVITLVEGSIELTTQKERILMVPNNQISISRNDGSSVLNNVNASVYGAWRDGKFVYDKMPLKQIISDIARWYQVDVFYQNPSVQSKRISMFTKKSNEINDILEIIEAAEDVRFELNGNSLLVRSK